MKRIFNRNGNLSSRSLLLLATIAVATLSSCNRGVGCPTNFSLNDVVRESVALLVSLV